ncbi:MAG: dihydropteroate synthase [Campylobacterales bacterium]
MEILSLSPETNWRALMEKLNVDQGGIAIMERKSSMHHLLIRGISSPAANILKQDALSVGAEVAVAAGVVSCEVETSDALLMATEKQLRLLARKELAQPYGLKELGRKLSMLLMKPKDEKIRLMGVVNVNSDSFYAQSRSGVDEIVSRAAAMIEDGADIIDIGAVSSRPGSLYPGIEEEMRRLHPVVLALEAAGLINEAIFSLDSFAPTAIEFALDHGFRMINDITGCNDPAVARLAARYDAELVIMHMKGVPKTMQIAPTYDDLLSEITNFFTERIARAQAEGARKIILDVGIGFGKELEHNLMLIKHLGHFKHFQLPLLIGASRKSMINAIIPAAIEERLPGTLALHQKALDAGATIIRAHDVKEHKQMIEVWKALKNTLI